MASGTRHSGAGRGLREHLPLEAGWEGALGAPEETLRKHPLEAGTTLAGHQAGSQSPDVVDRVGLGEVISDDGAAWTPKDSKMPQSNPITHPVVAHEYGFGSLLLHCVVGNALGTTVVCGKWCWALRISQVRKGVAHGFAPLCVHEQTDILGLGSGGADCRNDCAEDVDSGV